MIFDTPQNLYYDWLFAECRRLIQVYLNSLRTLADFHYAHKRFTRSQELLQRALRVDTVQEDLYCRSLRVFAALGDHAGLINQYQEMKRTIARELDLEPLPATETLYQKLLETFKN